MQQRNLIPLTLDIQKTDSIIHFTLSGLLSNDYLLALNLETRSLSLLTEGPRLVMGQQFSISELRVFLPILESFPHYSPYEVLLAHMESDNVSANYIEFCLRKLMEAQESGTWQLEMRPLRRTLSSLRKKLHPFNLEISTIRERGCNLTSLAHTSASNSSTLCNHA